MEWILASASPRRKQLFAEIVEKFDIVPAKGEENVPEGFTPEQTVRHLAWQKAEEISRLPQSQGKAILGADTVVALGANILGKPKDEADAEAMLTALSGNVHQVYTGICIFYPKAQGGYDVYTFSDCTKVLFYSLSKQQIKDYVSSGSPMDKAGAYGIQDGGLVQEIEGSFSNVVGLPVELLKREIQNIEQKNKTAGMR